MRAFYNIVCGVSALVAMLGCWLLTRCEYPALATVCLTLPASLLVTLPGDRRPPSMVGPGVMAWSELSTGMVIEGFLAWSLCNPFTGLGPMHVRWYLTNLLMAGVVVLLCVSVLRRGSRFQRALAAVLVMIPAGVCGAALL